MSNSSVGPPLDNKLLASLPREDFDRLLPYLSTVSLQQGIVLFEAGDEVDQIYFPHDGMLSLLAVLRDGKAIETATVGREGVVGAMAGLGLYKSLVRVVVQMQLTCSKIAATHFRTAAAASDPIRNLCIRYNEVLLSQARVTAACNALHPIEARFCRWLLQSADRGASDTVELTQRPKTRVPVSEEDAIKLMKLIDALDDNDDVSEVHANFDVDADLLERLAG